VTTVVGTGSDLEAPFDDERPNRFAVARLLFVLAAIVALSVIFHEAAYLVVVLALVVMVMVHELGHYLTAKLSGMKVTEYFFGFGPRLWSFVRGETRYGVKAIPAGGYVRIVGMTMLEEVPPEDEARTYRQATFPRRLLVAVAGSAMHVVMAFALIFSLYCFSGIPTAVSYEVTSLETFASGASPAEQAGFRTGDVFVSIDGHDFNQPGQFTNFIRSHVDDTLKVVVLRDGRDVTLRVRPTNEQNVKVVINGKSVRPSAVPDHPSGVIGVTIESFYRDETTNPISGVHQSVTMLGSLTSETFGGIATVFSLSGLRSFAHDVRVAGNTGTSGATSTSGSSTSGSSTSSSSSSNSGQIMSIVGAVQLGAQALRHDIPELLYLLAAINIFVGVVNLFPMLPLDGGHVAIAIYERVRSRRGKPYHADITKLMPLAYLFLLFMVVIGLGALYANIRQPVGLPGG